MQIFCAAWNVGELGFGPPPDALSCTPTPPFGPAWTFGSGKFGTPWERMQVAISSAALLRFLTCVAEIGGGLGMYFAHAFWAAWKAGALTGTPLTVIEAPEPALWLCWMRRPPPLVLLGSGKFGTPWERTQLANLRPSAWTEAADWLPIVGLEEPQAASSRAAVTMSDAVEASLSMGAMLVGSDDPVSASCSRRQVTRRLRLAAAAPFQGGFDDRCR
jgi:hypothetical protein